MWHIKLDYIIYLKKNKGIPYKIIKIHLSEFVSF